MAEAAEVVDTAEGGIEAANEVLDLYNKSVNQLIPWDAYKQAIKALKENKRQYSDAAAAIVGQVQTLLMNSHDEYDSSLEEVNRWCKMAVPVLEQYITLFEMTSDPKIAEAQKLLLLKVLNDGSTHMDSAITKLEVSKKSFNDAYGQLTTLKTQLDKDLNEEICYLNSAHKKALVQSYFGAASGIVFGPIGFALTYSLAVGSGYMRTKNLDNAFEKAMMTFFDLQASVQMTQQFIKTEKDTLTKRIRALGTMSAKIEETKHFAEIWALVSSAKFDVLKKSTNQLIDMCEQFIAAAEFEAFMERR